MEFQVKHNDKIFELRHNKDSHNISFFYWGHITNHDGNISQRVIAKFTNGKFVNINDNTEYIPSRPYSWTDIKEGQIYIGLHINKETKVMHYKQAYYKGVLCDIEEHGYTFNNTFSLRYRKIGKQRWYKVNESELEYPKSIVIFHHERPIVLDESYVPQIGGLSFGRNECEYSHGSSSSNGCHSNTTSFDGVRIYDRVKFSKENFSGCAFLTDKMIYALAYDDILWNIISSTNSYDVEFETESYESYTYVTSARMQKNMVEELNARLKVIFDTYEYVRFKTPTVEELNPEKK